MKSTLASLVCLTLFAAAASAEPRSFVRGDKVGFLNDSGYLAIPPVFDEAGSFSGDRAIVRMNDFWGIVNSDGTFVLPPAFDEIVRSRNDMFRVRIGGRWGLVNNLGAFIVPPTFDALRDFDSDGLAKFSVGTSIGYLNSDGRIVWSVH